VHADRPLRDARDDAQRTLRGARVLITGAARGIGALTAKRLHERGARVALLGLEPELLEAVAAECGDAPWFECDVADRDRVDRAVAAAVETLGGLDVAIANAGIGAQMPLVGGDPAVWDAHVAVNLNGTYNLIRAAGPHVSHPGGYFLVTASLAAAVHLPLMAAYCATKAAVESLGDSLRMELAPSGAKAGVAYYAELDTDMTSRGFATKAAARMPIGGGHRRRSRWSRRLPVAPVGPAIDAIERGILRRSRRIVSPRWVAAALPFRMVVQRLAEQQVRGRIGPALEIARTEEPPLTTPQPMARTARSVSNVPPAPSSSPTPNSPR
jgi:NAD(P)-dependent dehydrogenase (short-subunit alcohol dehydrogenase family)